MIRLRKRTKMETERSETEKELADKEYIGDVMECEELELEYEKVTKTVTDAVDQIEKETLGSVEDKKTEEKEEEKKSVEVEIEVFGTTKEKEIDLTRKEEEAKEIARVVPGFFKSEMTHGTIDCHQLCYT